MSKTKAVVIICVTLIAAALLYGLGRLWAAGQYDYTEIVYTTEE